LHPWVCSWALAPGILSLSPFASNQCLLDSLLAAFSSAIRTAVSPSIISQMTWEVWLISLFEGRDVGGFTLFPSLCSVNFFWMKKKKNIQGKPRLHFTSWFPSGFHNQIALWP
jgi:hypothetical protein